MELKHNDAFMIMQYRCDRCYKEEMIWNGRNAVSPFSISCPCGHSMYHVNWHQDKRALGYNPPPGSRYFADFTLERAKEVAKQRMDQAKGTEFELQEGTEQYDDVYLTLVEDFMHGGCAIDTLTAGE